MHEQTLIHLLGMIAPRLAPPSKRRRRQLRHGVILPSILQECHHLHVRACPRAGDPCVVGAESFSAEGEVAVGLEAVEDGVHGLELARTEQGECAPGVWVVGP